MVNLLLAIIYISFISLGFPDALLGSAWPSMYGEINAQVSYAGIISMIISAGTVVSSLMSDRLTYKLGTGKVTAISVAITAAALLGFSCSGSFWKLCLWAVPYGLGAGSVDASLNNYVALHYESKHMSWLHCMWGIGASVGPYIMGFVLAGGGHWNTGYRIIGVLQILLTIVLFFSLPLWKGRQNREETSSSEEQKGEKEKEDRKKLLTLGEIVRIPGVREIMSVFFCYCALEQTTGLWGSSFLVLHKGVDSETAASFASLFFVGITLGRALNGFLTMKFTDTDLIRLGQGIIAIGVAALALPGGKTAALIGLALIGLGCAPIYPCIIHSTPEHFGADKSQAIIGVQMASAYVGNCVMPPVFGLIADYISIRWLPLYLLIILVLMFFMHEKMLKIIVRQ